MFHPVDIYGYTSSTANEWSCNTDLKVTIPAGSFYCVTGIAGWSSGAPVAVKLTTAPSAPNSNGTPPTFGMTNQIETRCGYTASTLTFYVWGIWKATYQTQSTYIRGFYFKAPS